MAENDPITHARMCLLHEQHINRIRNMKPVVDSKAPLSMGPGMIHLKTRPKKQQLIDDRRHMIAMENKKMMENMTKIMMAPKMKFAYVDPPSLNEDERKMKVDLMNLDNRILYNRLKTVKPVISNAEMKEEWKHHERVRSHMQKKYKPPPYHNTPAKAKAKEKAMKERKNKKLAASSSTLNVDSMFDSATYTNNQGEKLKDMGGSIDTIGMATGSPIKSMAEFRKHVISKKQAANRGHAPVDTLMKETKTLQSDTPLKMDSLSLGGGKSMHSTTSMEMTHNPS